MVKVLMVCVQVALAMAEGTQDMGDWTSKDIGNVRAPGTATYNERTLTWTVRGSGSDIEGGADSFHYAYGLLEGDGFIQAKVESASPTDPWAKCGIMIRESTEPGSNFAAVYATPGNGVHFQARTGGGITTDSAATTREQGALRPPVWIKLERKDNEFSAYYAPDKTDAQWTPIVWKPQAIVMPKIVYVGLAVCSHTPGVLCESRFSNVTVPAIGVGIIERNVRSRPKEALAGAYQQLEQLGNWRADSEAITKYGQRIAQCLFTIAKAREINSKSAGMALPDYYRLVEILPDSPLSMEALAPIATLGGEKGLEYAKAHLDAKSAEDKDRFYVALMEDYSSRPETPERRVIFESFVQYVAQTSRFTSLEQIIADLKSEDQDIAVCKSLIECGMTQPASVQTAVVALRYMALKALKGPMDKRIQELLKWAATQFPDTKLSVCATAALADMYYQQGLYALAVETFQPQLFSGDEPESKIVETIENTLAFYRANTLLQATISPEQIYQTLSDVAEESERYGASLHCQRQIAEIRNLSLESFEQAAVQGVKRSESGPENEVWFWKGFIAAGEGDLGTAAAAYERFLQGDSKSILAARAYYDVARTKMALGEDARAWVAKAKALSPCDAVLQLEQRLGTSASARN
jgi:tetratricopeptide (TPR) repeat protein